MSDTTPNDDLPDRDGDGSKTDEKAPSFEFLVYVVPGTSSGTPILASTGQDGIDIADDFGPKRIDSLFTVTDDFPLTYEVQGSGRVYVRITPRGRSSYQQT